MALTDSLVDWWSFAETDEDGVVTRVGSHAGASLAVFGADLDTGAGVFRTPGVAGGYGVAFAGQTALGGTSPNFKPDNDWTCAAWYRNTAVFKHIVGVGNSFGGWALVAGEESDPRVMFWTDSGADLNTYAINNGGAGAPPNTLDGAWHLAIVSYDAGDNVFAGFCDGFQFEVFLSGLLDAGAGPSYTLRAGRVEWLPAALADYATPTDAISQLAYWTRVLTVPEMQLVRNGNSGIGYTLAPTPTNRWNPFGGLVR